MTHTKYKKLTAALLHYEHGKTQEEIASVLGTNQTTVGRWLKSADVTGRLKKRYEIDIALEEHEAAMFVSDFQDYHGGVDCTLVQEGPDKNIDLLAEAAARVVLKEFKSAFDIRRNGNEPLDIVISSGETVRRTLQRFVELLARQRLLVSAIRQSGVVVRLFPAALAWARQLHALFPSAVVVSTWVHLRELLSDDHLAAFVPSIPSTWVARNSKRRSSKAEDVAEIFDDAKRAAIIVCSVGTVGEATYPQTLHALGFSEEEALKVVRHFPKEVGELLYVPFIEHELDNAPAATAANLQQLTRHIESSIVGLHAGDLVAAASNPAQTVICAAGGSYKRQAVCDAALGFGPGRSIANRFILDSSAASYWMSHAKYPKRVIDAVHQVHASSHR